MRHQASTNRGNGSLAGRNDSVSQTDKKTFVLLEATLQLRNFWRTFCVILRYHKVEKTSQSVFRRTVVLGWTVVFMIRERLKRLRRTPFPLTDGVRRLRDCRCERERRTKNRISEERLIRLTRTSNKQLTSGTFATVLQVRLSEFTSQHPAKAYAFPVQHAFKSHYRLRLVVPNIMRVVDNAQMC